MASANDTERFTDEEDRKLALLIAENEGHLNGTLVEKRIAWSAICSSFYASTGRTAKSREQIRQRYHSMKRSEAGKVKLKDARDEFAAAQALLELASASGLHVASS